MCITYPLSENYKDSIRDFIVRLKNYTEIEVVINTTSTQIVDEHAYVFDSLKKETTLTFTSGQNVFVTKILGFERDIGRKKED